MPGTVYVAPHGTAGAHDHSCGTAAFSSVQSAVSAARPGGAVVVCGGTYDEDVTVSAPLSLIGEGHAVIDATGKINGILIRAPHVLITGMKESFPNEWWRLVRHPRVCRPEDVA